MKYTSKEYARTLYDLTNEISPDESRDLIKKFVRALAVNGDLSRAGVIIEDFEKIWREERGEEKIEVTVAESDVAAILEDKLRGEVQVSRDPKVLGGVKIRIGDKLIDNTIRARINRLKDSLRV